MLGLGQEEVLCMRVGELSEIPSKGVEWKRREWKQKF